MDATVTLQSESDTKLFAECLAQHLMGGQVVGLQGDLGAGKTTLVRFLVGALGGAESHVSSPSFTLEHEYTTATNLRVEHWDLYRLRALPAELLEPPGPTVIRIVEWPDRIAGYAGTLDLVIALSLTESGARELHVSGSMAEKVHQQCKKFRE